MNAGLPLSEAGQGIADVKRCLPESMQKSGASIKKLRESIGKMENARRINREKSGSINKSTESIEKKEGTSE
ncbi:hypothetical protein [Salibacterium qingdaonense]|uniref:Uncharacterized protein n=1 Tax=Salibacterium qingdaonense TaxID=266892 RepID=A0A1I4L247_9BACI|nr:hypothetical protein [Salibacterium qingdaonense]SFL84747.1 hypothetical protein SAMN04488054_106102 [Salibacterium qingdaonense]